MPRYEGGMMTDKNNKPIKGFRDSYRFLSNFWYVDIKYGDVTFPTTEHAYQAAKSNDPLDWYIILSCRTPGEAKMKGKSLPIRPDWDEIKLDVMYQINVKKYEDDILRQKLLDTGDADLVEENSWGDVFWGMCNGKGENHLGKTLMRIREEIRLGVTP
jgi:ribA/ribD-fused uncharacterized protein